MSDPGLWFRFGQGYAAAKWVWAESRRWRDNGGSRRRAIVVLVVAAVAALLATALADAVEAVTSKSSSGRNWPPGPSPAKKMELHWETRHYREPRVPWPPFTGTRVQLGGDTA